MDVETGLLGFGDGEGTVRVADASPPRRAGEEWADVREDTGVRLTVLDGEVLKASLAAVVTDSFSLCFAGSSFFSSSGASTGGSGSAVYAI